MLQFCPSSSHVCIGADNSLSQRRLFEPWTITSRQHSVPSDERFRGYGKNKVQQVHAQMHVHDTR